MCANAKGDLYEFELARVSFEVFFGEIFVEILICLILCHQSQCDQIWSDYFSMFGYLQQLKFS